MDSIPVSGADAGTLRERQGRNGPDYRCRKDVYKRQGNAVNGQGKIGNEMILALYSAKFRIVIIARSKAECSEAE